MEDIITSYNKQSTVLIKSQKYQQAFQILMKCIKLLESIKETQLSYRLLSTTYSNFSALYKETGKLPESNKFLLKVIEIEKKLPTNKINSINADLSLCSNFSGLNDHEVALRYGLTGLMLLQKEFPMPEVLVPVTVIAYHNVGVLVQSSRRSRFVLQRLDFGQNKTRPDPFFNSLNKKLVFSFKPV